jgi:hypothetical protein
MKKITLLLFFISFCGLAQIKGNKDIETRTFKIENIKTIKINLYAKVTIDQSAREGLTITADTNLFDLIEKEVINNTLYLDQKEWIQASQNMIIHIGAPELKRIISGTHDTTKIINVDNDELQVNAPIGNVIIEGKTKELRIGSELSKIDATKLLAENALVNLWSWGTVKVNVINTLWANVSNDGKLLYVNQPKKLDITKKKGGNAYSLNEEIKIQNTDAVYIKFKIKNNSLNRINFKVVGPKPDGSNFGYGFPMMPNAVRKENWTIGTKVYRVNPIGLNKLLVTIGSDDENKTVNLFQ